MTDRVQCLRDAAQARHDATLRRAEDTLRRLARRGEPITYRRVAEQAGVSRSWLYRQTTFADRSTSYAMQQAAPSPRCPPLNVQPSTHCANRYTPTATR